MRSRWLAWARKWTHLLVAAASLLAGCSGPAAPPQEDSGTAHAGPAPGSTGWTPAWAPADQAPLRPGAHLDLGMPEVGSVGDGCTFDWLFVAPANGTYYVGTAAHCTGGPGTPVALKGHGAIGWVAYQNQTYTSFDPLSPLGPRPFIDFSLVRLAPEANLLSNPQMHGADGPVGWIDCKGAALGDMVQIYGYGGGGHVAQARGRSGPLVECPGPTWGAEVGGIPSDSGAPLLHAASRKALGVVDVLCNGCAPPQNQGTTMAAIFAALAEAGWGGVRLATVDGGWADARGEAALLSPLHTFS